MGDRRRLRYLFAKDKVGGSQVSIICFKWQWCIKPTMYMATLKTYSKLKFKLGHTHTHEEFHQSRWVRSSEWASTRVCIEIGRPTKPLCKSHTHKIFISWQTWQISLAPRVVYTGLRGAFRSSKSSKWRNPYSSVPTGHQANHTRHLVDWERANFSTNSPISLSHS